MNNNEELIEKIVRLVLARVSPAERALAEGHESDIAGQRLVPVAISARHVHLSREHVQILFGRSHTLEPRNPLSQPGQYAAKETVTLVGPRRSMESVRVLGPARSSTQVELSVTDGIYLGLKIPVKDSGDITGSKGLSIVGPAGCVHIPEGVIAARRHIHASPEDARKLGLRDGQTVSVRAQSRRPVVFEDILVRVNDAFALEMHLDTDEANACLVGNGDYVEIV